MTYLPSRLWQSIFGVCILALLTSCGPVTTTPKEPRTVLNDLKSDTTGRIPAYLLEKRIAERNGNGDTLPADAQKMLRVFTDSIPGYRMEIATADTLKLPFSILVEVRKIFYGKDEDFIEFSMGDYVRDEDLIRANWLRFNIADSVPVSGSIEDRRTIPGFLPEDLPASCTWSAYSHTDRTAQVFAILDGRYFMTINLPLQKGMLDLSRVRTWLNWDSLK